MSEKEPHTIPADPLHWPKKAGGVILRSLKAMGNGFEAQNTDNIGTRAIAFDIMTGNLGKADAALKLTPVPDAPPKDLAIKD